MEAQLRSNLSEGDYYRARTIKKSHASTKQAMGRERLFSHTREYLDELLHDISACKKSIEIEMYIWQNDKVGKSILRALEAAADRGVVVRLVVDGVGSFQWVQTCFPLYQRSKIHVRVHRPISLFSFFSLFFPDWQKYLNRRNHRKVVIIDESIAYLGSINFMQEALNWFELGLRTHGPVAKVLRRLFESSWFSENSFPDRRQLLRQLLKSQIVRSNQFYVLRRKNRLELAKRIRKSERRIWVMTPYFLPPKIFLAALLKTRRGLDVRLILPARSDIWYFPFFTRLYYRTLIGAGIKIYEYQAKILHAKAIIIDAWHVVGSSNLNYRSSYRDLELDYVLQTGAACEELERQMLIVMQESRRVLDHVSHTWFTLALQKVHKVFRGWL